jgi:hypothetical protein
MQARDRAYGGLTITMSLGKVELFLALGCRVLEPPVKSFDSVDSGFGFSGTGLAF